MRRKGCLIVTGVCGVLVVLLILLAFILRHPWGTRTIGGPVALVNGEPPRHGFLGVDFDKGAAAPLTIRGVLKGSGAADAGLQPGDVILAAGAVERPDLAALRRAVQGSTPGEELLLKIGRGPDELDVRVRLISFMDMILLREREHFDGTAPQ